MRNTSKKFNAARESHGVDFISLVSGAALGALTMYALDPDRGRRRRSLASDKLNLAWHELRNSADVTARDLANRTRGVMHGARSRFERGEVDDEILRERVRSKIGRLVSHPHAVEVDVDSGEVRLRGRVLEYELDGLIEGVERVKGVKGVRPQMEVHRQPGDIPDLQGGTGRRYGRTQLDVMQQNWAPSTRFLVGTAGALATLMALGRRSFLLGGAGMALLTRSIANQDLPRVLGRRGRRAVDLMKTIHVAAPVEEVYAFWRNFENFPRFMSHIKSVEQSADGGYRWTVSGPAGATVSWNARITRESPYRMIAWRSERDSAVANAGIVRFDRQPFGTRIHIRMSYNPPGGTLGHTVAAIFGADPKSAMDEDLARFKDLIEVGKTGTEGRHVTRSEIAI